MKGPPDAIVAAPAKVAATEDCQTELTMQVIADEAANVNEADDDAKVALYIDSEHRRAPQPLRGRFCEASTPTSTDLMMPRLARVRFDKFRFYFDPEGRWAVIAPIFEERRVANWAAFDVDDDTLRRTFRPGHVAVGLDDAAWNARFHPQNRLLVHYSVWSWLRCGCTGVLPVDWKEMGIYILREGYGLHGCPIDDAIKAEAALECALKLSPMFPRAGDEP